MRKTLTPTLVACMAVCMLGGSAIGATNTGKVNKPIDQSFTFGPDSLKADPLTPVIALGGIRRTPKGSLIQLRWDFIDKILKSSERI